MPLRIIPRCCQINANLLESQPDLADLGRRCLQRLPQSLLFRRKAGQVCLHLAQLNHERQSFLKHGHLRCRFLLMDSKQGDFGVQFRQPFRSRRAILLSGHLG